MEFNNRRERKRFETEWAKLRQEYHNAGMSEDAIQSLYLFDFSVFKRSRSIAAWEEPFENESEDGESKEYALLHRYASLLSKDDTYFADADRFSWIERISDEALYTKHSLSKTRNCSLCWHLMDIPKLKLEKCVVVPRPQYVRK